MSPIDPSFLRMNIEDITDRQVFNCGKGYYYAQRVTSITFDHGNGSIVIHGKIRGSKTYKTNITLDEHHGTIAEYECDCPYDFGKACKHVVALGLAAADVIEEDQTETADRNNGRHTQSVTPVTHSVNSLADMRQKLQTAGIDATHLPDALIVQLLQAMQPAQPLQAQMPLQFAYGKDGKKISHVQTVSYVEKGTIPKPLKPFRERFYISFKTYGGEFHEITLSKHETHSHMDWYESNIVNIKNILTEKNLSPKQTEILTLFAEYEARTYEERKKHPIDPVRLFTFARQEKVEIYQVREYDTKRKLTWVEPEKIHTILSTEMCESVYGQYSYERIIVSVTNPTPQEVSAIGYGENGIVLIRKGTLEIHILPTLLAHILERTAKHTYEEHIGYHDDKEKPETGWTALLDNEYTHINDIIRACREYTQCDVQMREWYTVTEHKAKAVMVVDYVSEDKKLSVLPSVDYGGVILSVCDTMLYSNSYGNRGTIRRQDGAFGKTLVVRIENETIHIAPVAEKIEKTLFKLGIEKSEILGISRKSHLTARGDKQIAFAAEMYLPKIKALGYEMRYPHDILDISNANFTANFDIDFDSAKDWLAFDMDMYCGDERVQLEDIEACLKSGTNMVTMKDGRIFKITNPEAMKRIVDMLVHFRKNDSGQYEGRSYNAPELDAVSSGSRHYTSRVSTGFKSFIQEAKRGKVVNTVKIPKPFSTVLRDYQIAGVHWLNFLHHYRFAGILADDMGLGKTLQALAILSIHANEKKPSLVVAPKTLLHNWENEVKTFSPHLKTKIIDGTQAEREAEIKTATKHDLIITSYPALQRDIETYEKHKISFNYCVIDEAQYIKNPRTKNAHSVRRVQSDYRLALTGTPLENGVEELWSSFDFLMPGFLGHHAHFQKNLGNPIMKYSDGEALERLRTKVKCFMLRRTKEEVLKELPPKVEQIIQCKLSDEQNILYQDVLKRVQSDIKTQVKKRVLPAHRYTFWQA